MSPRNKNKQSFPFEVSNTNPSKCLFIEKKNKTKNKKHFVSPCCLSSLLLSLYFAWLGNITAFSYSLTLM